MGQDSDPTVGSGFIGAIIFARRLVLMNDVYYKSVMSLCTVKQSNVNVVTSSADRKRKCLKRSDN